MINNKIIGERLAIARARTDAKSSRQFALKGNVDDSQYVKVENGEKGLKWESLTELCSAWGINLDWILTGKGRILLSDPDPMDTPLALGEIKVTVAEYLELLKEYKTMQGDVIKSLLQEKEANSKQMAYYADEVMKNMHADHDRMMAALDRIEGHAEGTIAREADNIVTGFQEAVSNAGTQKGAGGKKGKS